MTRAESSGRRLTAQDASLVKGMIQRGDRHHDIAAWFGVNQGRIAEVKDGTHFGGAPVAAAKDLPPPGPYSTPKTVQNAIQALETAAKTLESAMGDINQVLKALRKGG